MSSSSPLETIFNFNWDILIVLDACRYDYCTTALKYFMKGKIMKLKSVGSCTLEWLKNTFKNRYFEHLIYISGNPYINKLPCKDFTQFCASNHLDKSKIIEGFKTCWTDPGTTDPICLSQKSIIVKEYYDTVSPAEKIIIHYLQPHAPYIAYNYDINVNDPIEWIKDSSYIYIDQMSIIKKKLFKIYRIFERRLISINWLPNLTYLSLRDLFGFPPAYPTDQFRRLYGLKELKNAYLWNLLYVLSIVSSTVKLLLEDGRLVAITSDHGECLGENGWLDHPCYKNIDILRNVFIFYPEKVIRYNKKLYNRLKLIKHIRNRFK